MNGFDRNYIEQELKKINKNLKKPISVYIIGGSAMSFYDLKVATKDIDVIVKSNNDAASLIKTLELSGYKKIEKIDQIYMQMKTRAIIENTDGFRWDIFVNKVCGGLTFSKDMASRSKLYKKFKRISIYLISPEDIFIFKSVTSRPRDREDMHILFSHGLDINVIEKEIQNQSQKDKSMAWIAFFFIGLNELVEDYNVVFPKYKEFLQMAEDEMIERLVIESLKKKSRTIDDLTMFLRCSKKEMMQIIVKLQKKNLIRMKTTKNNKITYASIKQSD